VGGICHEVGLTASYQLETDRWQKTSMPTSYRWQPTVEVDIRRVGINGEHIPGLVIDSGAWRELTDLCVISIGGKVR